ncbi:hypothetical protein AAFO92_22380 [Roseovarius sp. CAU 1744]|uniref:hypothetical protein n=1 Tax=Roseovarius sp. CAU 1744 TaxID=3140368 RepID=UPI00325B44FE
MSKIEDLTAELCDQLMQKASAGDLESVKKTVVMLIEYAAYEVARHRHSNASSILFCVAKECENILPGNVRGARIEAG